MKYSITLAILLLLPPASVVTAQSPKFRHVETQPAAVVINAAGADAIAPDSIRELTARDILDAIPLKQKKYPIISGQLAPRIFVGYRETKPLGKFDVSLSPKAIDRLWSSISTDSIDSVEYVVSDIEQEPNPWNLADFTPPKPDTVRIVRRMPKEIPPLLPVVSGNVTPEWMTDAIEGWKLDQDIIYLDMVARPKTILYTYWELPEPPQMPTEDTSYKAFLKKNRLAISTGEEVLRESEIEKRHWLHVFNAGLQFSQAYLSKNWYQGGNNYLALLTNLYWDVQLNQVYHPKIMFQSTLSYKLGLNSTEDNDYHKYSISEDLFQYNLKFGYKAAHNWYYSFTTQFKTQLLNNYPKDSNVRTASFLTPGNLTLGLGMTYSKQNKKKTLTFNASISPLSYNLKTAIDPKVDHGQFGMEQNEKTVNEFGSTAELTLNWNIASNVLYKSRLFLFTDYKDSQADWQNTFEFQFNRFFSTQLYFNLRYDSQANTALAPGWHRWMLKEILSVGLSYTFSTKK